MRAVVHLLWDPKIFNYIIILLYACNTVRWTFARSVGDVCYWGGALLIICGVTFGFKR